MKKSLYLLMAACVFAACNMVEPTGDGGEQKPGRDDKTPAGVEAVDLGLSVKWASCNLGASSPVETGNHYAWGEITPKENYDWSTYKWCMGSDHTLTKYCTDPQYGYNGFVDNKIFLDPEDDAATENWGGKWRMPTEAEWTELRDNCTWTPTTMTDASGFGIAGYKITSNKNGYADKWIFLPAAGIREGTGFRDAPVSYGWYWSSSLSYTSPFDVGFICLGTAGELKWNGGIDCNLGLSVRPVYAESYHVTSVSLEDTTVGFRETVQLTATVTPSSAYDKRLTWTSSDESVVMVFADGVVWATGKGTAEVTVKTVDGGYTATCTVSVIDPSTPEAVDLGLSVNWASFNVGASAPEKCGAYFAWGETAPKEDYSWSTYKWCNNGNYNQLTKYCNISRYGYNGFTDDKTVLDPEDDAATVNWGSKWRIPTGGELEELRTNCIWEWTTLNGVYGRKVTSKKEGYTDKSIFLPAAGSRLGTHLSSVDSYGYYWSSSCYSGDRFEAYSLYFNSGYEYMDTDARCSGIFVRPVCGFSVVGVSLDKTSIKLVEGNSITLIATITPSNAANNSVTWTSSDSAVAKVSAAGVVEAISIGTCTIKVTTNDGGLAAECTVSVEKMPVPEAVDLGLSVKWASFNLGAFAPEEYGAYFAWGETEPKMDYSWSTYKWCNGDSYQLTKYCTNSRYGYNGFVDDKKLLGPEDDAATVNLGGGWRMPTYNEVDELRTQCTWTWTTFNGVYGRKIISKKEGYTNKWIFLPAAGYRDGTSLLKSSYGYYWSLLLDTAYPDCAYSVCFDSGDVFWYHDYFDRYGGRSVRPVYATHVTGVSVSPENATINFGESLQLTATITPANAPNKGVTWSSSDESVATVSDDGVVTAVGNGTAEITVRTSDGGYCATCTVSATVELIVDLGLSVKWALFNVGASCPLEYGDYFAWGETAPKSNYSWSTYKWCNGSSNTMTKYCTNSSYGYNGFTDNKTVLDPEDDAATVNWGGKWRMPTGDEISELYTQCAWEWTTLNGVNGRKVTSKKEGYTNKSIFLPAAGDRYGTSLYDAGSSGLFWSSSLYTDEPYDAYRVGFGSGYVVWYNSRYCGFSVRPVYGESVQVTGISVSPQNATISLGGTQQLTAKITPANAENKSVTWSSSDTSVATVNADGLVTGLAEGTALITVTTVEGAYSASCTVSVEQQIIDIKSSITPTSYANDAIVAVGGFDFYFNQTACYSAGVIQMKRQVSYVANKTAFPKPIVSVTILGGGAAGTFYASNYKCCGGTSEKPENEVTGTEVEDGTRYDFTGKGYTFFKLSDPSNYGGKLVKISIEYEK